MNQQLNITAYKGPITHLRGFLLATLVGVLVVWGVINFGVTAAAAAMLLPPLGFLIYLIIDQPRVGMVALFVVNYFAMGISRYLPGPLGLSVDLLLALMYIALILKSLNQKGLFKPAARTLSYLALVWYGYALFQLFNPEALSRTAWFFAMRGFSLYFAMTIPLTFILFNRRKDLDLMLNLWSVFTLLAIAKGVVQLMGYVDPFEIRWLNEVGGKTHIIGGQLRIFSFFTDAGQFGAAMGFSGVVFGICSLGAHGRRRWYLIAVSALAFFGMLISGTRGAIAVPAAGFLCFALVAGSRKVALATAMLYLGAFAFLKFTHIGDSNYHIARMRTAFNGNDASLQARLINQNKLASYLASRPFGGGIGSAGNWGKRFSPNGFLANVPTDSWYVSIWAEQGVVGLTLHLCILMYVLLRGGWLVLRVKDKVLGYKLKALLAGIAGVMVASYGNGVMGQMPTGMIAYMSMAFLMMSRELDCEPFASQKV